MGKNKRLAVYLAIVAVLILTSISSLRLVHAQGPTPTTPNPIELVGSVTMVDTAAKTITVNGLTINISKAQIAASVQLMVGTVVKVEGSLLADGTIAAREVKAAVAAIIQPGEMEIVGVVESLNATQIVINGQTIDISKAEIGKGVAVGMTVRVHATVAQGGMPVAREVSVFNQKPEAEDNPKATPTGTLTTNPGNQKEFELTGTLEQVGTDFVVISGQQISTSGAEIKGQLVVGALVKIHVSNTSGGLVAREVELAQKVDDDVNDDNNKATPSGTKVGPSKGSGDKSGSGGKDDGQKPDDKGQDGSQTGSNSGSGSSGSGSGGSGGGNDGGGHDAGDDNGGH